MYWEPRSSPGSIRGTFEFTQEDIQTLRGWVACGLVAVKAISEAIKALDEGLFNGAETWVSRICSVMSTGGIFSCAGSHRFGIYETDFGWGRPKKAEVVSTDTTGAISFSDSMQEWRWRC